MSARSDRWPLWALLLLGWLAGGTVRLARERRLDPAWVREARTWPRTDDPEAMGARELRTLPGVGERRALDLARALLDHDPAGGPFRWSSVRGIGPRTEERITAWAARRAPRAGGEPDPGAVAAATTLQKGVDLEMELGRLRRLAARFVSPSPAADSPFPGPRPPTSDPR